MARDARSDSRETVVSASGSEDENDPLVCPLTGDLFECPVLLLQSGETYEAGALALALAKEPGVDPWTRLPFSGAPATAPNKAVAALARRRRKEGGGGGASSGSRADDAKDRGRGLPPPRHHDRYRTKLCRFGDRCPYLATNECQYIHPEPSSTSAATCPPCPPAGAQNPATRSYKTKICRFGDQCPYLASNKCQFAHSVEELEHWKRVRTELPHVAGLMGYSLAQRGGGDRSSSSVPASPAPPARPFSPSPTGAPSTTTMPAWGEAFPDEGTYGGYPDDPFPSSVRDDDGGGAYRDGAFASPLGARRRSAGTLAAAGLAPDPWAPTSAIAGIEGLLGAPDPVSRSQSAGHMSAASPSWEVTPVDGRWS
mmetsp:Transcript_9672/g.30121  ORF Transcript_9672/g.30121 Transcript_9672/m.30121 type:complete len:369 (-) Transcript_9672:192-1298(-)